MMKRFADSHLHMTDNDFDRGRGMLDIVASTGVTDATLNSLPYRGKNYNLKMLYWKTHYDRMTLRAFGALHEFGTFSEIPPLEQAQKLIALGCDGIKMMEMDPLHRKQRGFGVNNPMYDPMYSWLEDQNLPVTMHVNDPESFWSPEGMTPERIRRGWFYGDGTYPTKQAIYDEVFEMLDKHPRLRVTFAHFFFLSNFPDEAERVMETYPNVNFDLTPGWEMYLGFSKDIDRWHDFFENYSGRILFGTDTNNTKSDNDKLHELVYSALTHDRTEFPMPCFFHDLIRGLDLSAEAVEKITWGSYAAFAGETPRPVDWKACLKEAERMLPLIEDDPEQESAADWLRAVLAGA